MTTTNTSQPQRRDTWLREFDEAHGNIRLILGAVDGLIDACYSVGNERLGDTLRGHVEALRENVDVMNKSVSRGISEDAQASWDQVGKTLSTLLRVSDTQPSTEGNHG